MSDSVELTLYSREGCGLCDEMLSELHKRYGSRVRVRVVNIAEDRSLVARYGERIPVLVHEGEELCFGRLNPDRLAPLLLRS
ncbi:hypothetical protein J2T60_000638 [Natronospira proteinivora]|uniref:Glutaredoxin family protein n=1 Tax=Natronospira proteinivora TaxID=1807133 RepID=A0ABT1G5V1_9GAMM|nr:glutaredoxin family protein [Natronospira proteinivora]MCP1726673.1 hypothetical protein [Natronospira proteinivora]